VELEKYLEKKIRLPEELLVIKKIWAHVTKMDVLSVLSGTTLPHYSTQFFYFFQYAFFVT
jgi:hypothetical protein